MFEVQFDDGEKIKVLGTFETRQEAKDFALNTACKVAGDLADVHGNWYENMPTLKDTCDENLEITGYYFEEYYDSYNWYIKEIKEK